MEKLASKIILLFVLLFAWQCFGAVNVPNRWDSGLLRNGRRINIYAKSKLPFKMENAWDYEMPSYPPSPLTPEQRFDILGIPNDWSLFSIINFITKFQYAGPSDEPGAEKHLVERMFFRSIHYVLGIEYSKDDESKWRNLAEKRHSFLRDLLTELSQLPGLEESWTAKDYRLPDGSYVFAGDVGAMVMIEAVTGDMYRGNERRSFYDHGKNGKPNFTELKKLDRKLIYCSYLLRP